MRQYAIQYNHLGQLTQVTDDAGVRTIGYNAYGEQETDSLLAGGKIHLVTEARNALGRPSGYIRTAYTYSPYGQVTTDGDVTQPIQWSSEFNDTELGLIYYNYRHYNPVDGRWTGRDTINTNESYKNAYVFDLKKYLQDINRLLFFLYVIIVEIQGNIVMKRGWITIGRKMLSCYMKRSTRLIGAHQSVTKR